LAEVTYPLVKKCSKKDPFLDFFVGSMPLSLNKLYILMNV